MDFFSGTEALVSTDGLLSCFDDLLSVVVADLLSETLDWLTLDLANLDCNWAIDLSNKLGESELATTSLSLTLLRGCADVETETETG